MSDLVERSCPFCGSDYLAIVEMPPSKSHNNRLTTFHVECRSCFMCGPQSREPQSRDGALLAWSKLPKELKR
jgi:hypothetical protein